LFSSCRKIIPVVGDVGSTSITTFVDEVGEPLDWILDLKTLYVYIGMLWMEFEFVWVVWQYEVVVE